MLDSVSVFEGFFSVQIPGRLLSLVRKGEEKGSVSAIHCML